MNRSLIVVCILAITTLSCQQKNPDPGRLASHLDSTRVLLPNGWSLTPAGTSIPLGDFPMNLVRSHSGKFMAVTNNGQGKQSIMLIDPASQKVLDTQPIAKAWFGLAFDASETHLYVSGGNDNRILVYDVSAATLKKSDSIVLGEPWPVRISPTGLTLDDTAHKLFVTTKEDSSLYIVDLPTKASTRVRLGSEAYSCSLSADRKLLFVSLWGKAQVACMNTAAGEIQSVIDVGHHPNDMVMTKDGRYLFVAQANDNSVSIIDTQSLKVVEVVSSAMYPHAPAGSTPNAVALSADDERLYIANADNNCLAVFDVSDPGHSTSLGFIPTGWYPTSVKVWNDKLWVTNGKGERSLPNPHNEYIASLFTGSLSVIPEPGDELGVYSAAAYKNSPYSKDRETLADGQEGNPIPRKKGDASPIKHVFYIIKENRTYDQVLGDVREGNGDSSLCIFPKRVTPNEHALAREFVLLDNFYVNAEVSADGHNWSTAAYANDYVEKTWPTTYGGRGGEYDYEGTREIAFPTEGFLWDYCRRAGISHRNYGEFVDNPGGGTKLLRGHYDPDYPGWDLKIPDATRLARWKADFDSMLAIHSVPQLSIIKLPNDHTAGAAEGSPTPRAMVAENDLALGQLIEHLAKSPIWKESVVFVVEDDAQAGPDHVDAHRSIAFVAGGYVKRGVHVATLYSTASVLRTIELILGLPPMSQYDAGATPMWECFATTPDPSPYVAKAATYDIHEMNPPHTALSRRTATFNLTAVDAAPDVAFNEVIWATVKTTPMPVPKRSAFVRQAATPDED